MISTDLTEKLISSFLDTGRIFLLGDITNKTMSSFILQMKYLSSKKDINDIYIYIHSDGGDVECAMAMIDEINMANDSKKNVYTIACGVAASAAAYILAYGKKRYGTENSTYMLHPFSYELKDYHAQNKEYVDFCDQFYKKIIVDVALRCKKTTAKAIDVFTKKIHNSLWMDTDAALDIGLIDEKWTYELEKNIDAKQRRIYKNTEQSK